MSFKKPRPRPATAAPAYETLSLTARVGFARQAEYVGSPHHTDIPKFGMQNNPRHGATTIELAEERGLKNPACTVCPRKWARRHGDVRALLRASIEAGHFIAPPSGGMPTRVWVRDPDDASLVYEAKLSHPPVGYKAYPLTSYQAEYNLPIKLP